MKKLALSIFCAMICFSCTKPTDTDRTTDTKEVTEVKEEIKSETEFGVAVNEAVAITLASLTEKVGAADSLLDLTVTGKVKEVCQSKGCWMTLEKEDGSTIRVSFKDYKLFMPKDLGGKEVALHGKAMKKTVSVETLQHFAKDAGKSEAEIAKITEPEIALAFEADGVKVQK